MSTLHHGATLEQENKELEEEVERLRARKALLETTRPGAPRPPEHETVKE